MLILNNFATKFTIKQEEKMNKKILILFALATIIVACNNSQKNSGEKVASDEPRAITVADVLTTADEYVGQEIKIQGTVSHTCRNGGKKMFIFDENEDSRVKIEASESVPSFDVSLEGSDVLVIGILNELVIDEAYLSEWEQEVNGEMSNPEVESDTTVVVEHEGGGLGEAADQGTHVSAMESIADYRKQIKESGKDHLSFYSVECISYEVLPADTIN
jgi:hypothetical protein